MNILHIDSSITGDASASRELTAAIVASLKDGNGDAEVTYRDLAAEPLSHLTLPAFGEEDSAEALAQFKAADTVVIGAPMYRVSLGGASGGRRQSPDTAQSRSQRVRSEQASCQVGFGSNS